MVIDSYLFNDAITEFIQIRAVKLLLKDIEGIEFIQT